jgi:hypothetical protein
MSSPPTRTLNPALGAFTSYTLAQSLTRTTPKGGLFTTRTANSYDSLRNIIRPVTLYGFSPVYFVDFLVDAASFDVKFRDNAGTMVGTRFPSLWMWVDEFDGLGWKAVTQYAEPTGANAVSGGAQVFRYTFSAARNRLVRVFFVNCDYAGVRGAATTTFQPAPHLERKVAILGDSWTDYAVNVEGVHSAWYTAALMLGYEPFLAGEAGTGYVTPGDVDANFQTFGHSTRIDPIVQAVVDEVWIEGSINDDVNNSASGATIQAGAAACYAALAAGLPNAPLVVFGPQPIGTPSGFAGDTDADRLINRNAVQAAAAAAPNVAAFIDPITEGWITGSGNTMATTGNGNADLLKNSVYHLAAYGHDTLAHRIVKSVTGAFAA